MFEPASAETVYFCLKSVDSGSSYRSVSVYQLRASVPIGAEKVAKGLRSSLRVAEKNP
jgi:hypothetical protein